MFEADQDSILFRNPVFEISKFWIPDRIKKPEYDLYCIHRLYCARLFSEQVFTMVLILAGNLETGAHVRAISFI